MSVVDEDQFVDAVKEETMNISNLKQVNSYRFLDRTTRTLVQRWIKLENPREIPWTPLLKSLNKCTIALVSSAGLALKTDQPFDQEGERQNPWWGDPTYRIIPRTTTDGDLKLYHLHMHPQIAEQDLNTILPLQRLLKLEECGEISRSAANHYSFMGYNMQPQVLLEESTPAMIQHMKQDGVDVVVIIPG